VKRFGTIDRVLLFGLLPVWGFWFTLHFYNVVRGRVAYLPIYLSAPQKPGSYPIVLRVDVPSGHGSMGTWEGLQIGDRLLRIGHSDLRGVWPVGFIAREAMATDASLRVALVFIRAGVRHEVQLPLFLDPFPWVWPIITISVVGVALLLLVRKPNSPLMETFFLAVILQNFHLTRVDPPFAPLAVTYAWAALFWISSFLALPLALRTVQYFPEDAVPAGRRLAKWPWLFSIAGLVATEGILGARPAMVTCTALVIDLAYGITRCSAISRISLFMPTP
jgi:hypothetical protein